MKLLIFAVAAAAIFWASALYAQSNIDNTVPDKYGWSENVGWTNWRDANLGAQGIIVGPYVMSGFIWSENIGWVNVGNGAPGALCSGMPCYANVDGADFGVNIDANGDLYGLAWGENVGWINFYGGAMATPPMPARINCGDVANSISARLRGYVWGENIGWINLDDATPTKFVALELAATPVDCDVDQDGFKNGGDIEDFVDILLVGGASWAEVCSGDQPPFDGALDLSDVAPFVNCLLTSS